MRTRVDDHGTWSTDRTVRLLAKLMMRGSREREVGRDGWDGDERLCSCVESGRFSMRCVVALVGQDGLDLGLKAETAREGRSEGAILVRSRLDFRHIAEHLRTSH